MLSGALLTLGRSGSWYAKGAAWLRISTARETLLQQ